MVQLLNSARANLCSGNSLRRGKLAPPDCEFQGDLSTEKKLAGSRGSAGAGVIDLLEGGAGGRGVGGNSPI